MTNLPVLKVERKGKEFLYAIANDHCAWRVKTLDTKEADTIEWIENMPKGDTFVDIGANIGIYTIFAAKHGLKVIAFEPEAQNYALLCRSIMVNDGIDATAYCLALSDEWKLDQLYLSNFLPGGSCHTFGADLDHRLEHRNRPAETLRQGALALPLDQLNLHADHIKIDCDGLEHKIVAGGAQTIGKCKSILVEINQALSEHMNTVSYLQEVGFRYDQAQVDKATRKEGMFKGCGNWIFYK